jgi:hypothetical protein
MTNVLTTKERTPEDTRKNAGSHLKAKGRGLRRNQT